MLHQFTELCVSLSPRFNYLISECLGIAGASYVPSVQAALPRLLSAAAPPVAGARENRRQCLKVPTLIQNF